ncbi:MAG TPA: Calx-beta domain-containing protein [Thermoleophilaceae bacterium]
MSPDAHVARTSLVSIPSRSGVRGALLVGALLLLALAFAPRADAAVYWANNDDSTIGRADIDGAVVNEAFITGAAAPFSVASDGAHVYWGTNSAARTIGRANIDGTGVNPNFINGVRTGAQAADAGHIYFTNLDTGSIGRANLDGTEVNPNFIPNAQAVFGLAVDGAHIYWSTFASIGRANLDGSGADPNFMLFDGFFDQPCGVAVDATHLYWANSVGTIGRAGLNGLGRDENFIRVTPAGDFTCGVAVDSAHLYWAHGALTPADAVADGIGRANLDGTGVNPTFVATPQPRMVAVDAATQAGQRSRVFVDDVSLAEGDAGQTALRFRVTLDQAPTAPVTVRFATADDTATAPEDYAANVGTVTFATGETAKTVTVQVNGDASREADETFDLNLTVAAGNAAIADGQGVGTIVNDDQPVTAPPVRISVDDVSVAEGDAGQTELRFTVSLDQAQPGGRVVVDYATADGSATAPGDYAADSGSLTFAAGDTTQTVTVQVNGDTTAESDETFGVNLSNVVGNATIADATGVGTIVNDDGPVIVPPSRISIGDVSMAEGNAGQTAFRATVSLDAAQPTPVAVDFATADGTASAASDYAANTGTVTFAPGETAKTVTVQVNGDTVREPNESFAVNLSNVVGNATIADGTAVDTIVNDDRRRRRHKFSLGSARANLETGTASLDVTVPGAGRLAISGRGVRALGAMARAVRAAGRLRLLIGASGDSRRTLNRTGAVTIAPRVTYTPPRGRPRTRSTTVRLRKR